MKKVIKEIRDNLGDVDKLSSLISGAGFADSRRAAINLHNLGNGLKGQEIFRRLLPSIINLSTETPDPDMGLNNLERFAAAYHDRDQFFAFASHNKDVLPLLMLLFGSSQYLSNFFLSSPQENLIWLAGKDLLKRPAGKESLREYLNRLISSGTSIDELKSILRKFRKREYIRISLRDMLGYGPLAEITREISDAADVCLQAAYEVCNRDMLKRYGRPMYTDMDGNMHECSYTVIGMGKHGGEELNYSSDIDIMYLYTSEKGETTRGLLTNHQYYVKLSEMISNVIGDTTDEGFVFRVDTRLRPEGARGDLASSLRSYEIYYESWGKTWERASLLKARPVAGDAALGRAFLSMIQPFVYRKYLDFTAISEIREMKTKIDRNIAVRGKDIKDVKRGYGGIREIEFFVQALQLLYGGKEPWIRERNTMRALHRLAQKGFISYEEEDVLSKAYQLLRRIEHMIQIVGERQTHIMPADVRDLASLAKRMGYKDKGRYTAHEQLQKDYNHYTQSVRKIYDDLFKQKGAEAEREGASDAEVISGDVVTEDEAVRILSNYHFNDPHRAYRNIILLRDGPPFSHQTPRSRQIFMRIFPLFFKQITLSSEPDHALNNLESLISSAGARETLYSFFEDNPQAIESVIRLFSNSEYLSKIVIRHPEIIDIFLDPAELLEKKTKDKLQGELSSALEQCGTYAERLDTLRRFKYTEELRIGYLDIMGYVDTAEASRYISALADASVAGALKITEAELRHTFGRPVYMANGKDVSARFCVIGMGKLGGEEITYGSDLDLIFLYSGEGETRGKQSISNHEYFSHLSSRVISALTSITREGTVFKVDVRLRPSGSKGPLCQSLEAFKSYVKGHADIWELQSLTRTRVIAGDESLGNEFITVTHDLIYNPLSPAFIKEGAVGVDLAASIRSMRQRMESEASKEDNNYYDIKAGRGGIVDIEFIVQYLKLLHGGKYPDIRITNTLLSLEMLYKNRLLPRGKYQVLKKSYTFLRTIESRLRIVHNMPSHLLPKAPERLTSLAKRMGYKETKRLTCSKRLLNEFESMREKVRGVFEDIVRASTS